MEEQQLEINDLKQYDFDGMLSEIEMLSTKVTETEAGRETYRKRFLEEREAKKYLEEDINRIRKECRAKLSIISTH